jgi:ABC-type glycerol-3-phosphate transport system substrate-binding protein
LQRRNRLLSLAAAGLAALGLTAGCTAGDGTSSGGSSASGQVTLTFLTFDTTNLTPAYWSAAIARTDALVPGVTIKQLVSPTTDRDTYAKQLLSSGQFPDLMIGVSPSEFVKAGELAPFSASQLSDFLYPSAGAIGGKTYVLPWATQAIPMVYYNKTDFAKAGISGAPSTWAQFMTDCAKLKAVGITPSEVGGGGTDTWADQYTLVAAVSADLYPQDPTFLADLASGKTSFNSPQFVAAAQKVATLASDGYLDKGGLSRSYANTEQAFRSNDAAMYPMGSWFPASADTDPPNFPVGVFTWPTDSGKPVLPIFTGGGLAVSSNSPNLALAQKWALAFSTNAANLTAEAKADGEFMAIKGYTAPNTLGANYLASYDIFKQDQAAGETVNAFSNETGTDSIPTGTNTDMYTGIQNLINGSMTAQQFASYLQSSYQKNADD